MWHVFCVWALLMEIYQLKAQFLELICFQNPITSAIDLRETQEYFSVDVKGKALGAKASVKDQGHLYSLMYSCSHLRLFMPANKKGH